MSTRISIVLEVLSAIAVILSLVFVGFEIRNSSEQVEQNTQALQIAAYQDLIGRIVEMNAIAIEGEYSIESLILIKSPSVEDTRKLNSHLWILFRHGDMAYFQYEQGAINAERLESAMAPMLLRLQHPTIVKRWRDVEEVFVPSFRSYINDHIQKIAKRAAT